MSESRREGWLERRRRRRESRRESRKKRAASGPEPVGEVVQALLARRGMAEKVERASVIARWEEIVGPHIARVAKPKGLRGTTLFVGVESAAWRTELGLMRPQLMRRINAGRKRGRIEKIVFVQADERVPEETDG